MYQLPVEPGSNAVRQTKTKRALLLFGTDMCVRLRDVVIAMAVKLVDGTLSKAGREGRVRGSSEAPEYLPPTPTYRYSMQNDQIPPITASLLPYFSTLNHT